MPSRRELMHSDYFSEDEDSYTEHEEEVYEDYSYSPYDSDNSDYENNYRYYHTESNNHYKPTPTPKATTWETVVLLKKDVKNSSSPPPVVEKKQAKTWGKIEKPVIQSLVTIQKEEVELAKRPPPPPPPPPQPHRQRFSDTRPRLLSGAANRPRILSTPSGHGVESNRDRNKSELLCIHGLRHKSSGCKMAHSFEDWNPKTCRFNTCRNGERCIYWHKQQEDRKQYFTRCVHNPSSFFFKNKDIYDRNYLNLSSSR